MHVRPIAADHQFVAHAWDDRPDRSEADHALLRPHLAPVTLNFRQRLQSANRRVKAAYFLESGIASVVAIATGSHSQTEVAVIGCEGIVGLPIVLRADRHVRPSFSRKAHRQCIEAADLVSVMSQSPTLSDALLRFAHFFSVQSGYTALANAHGKVEERLARWLLMAQDRIASKELILTHEFLALMLGVRRAGVTVALQHFEVKGLITAARGSMR